VLCYSDSPLQSCAHACTGERESRSLKPLVLPIMHWDRVDRFFFPKTLCYTAQIILFIIGHLSSKSCSVVFIVNYYKL
jgi:hypothetical protein